MAGLGLDLDLDLPPDEFLAAWADYLVLKRNKVSTTPLANAARYPIAQVQNFLEDVVLDIHSRVRAKAKPLSYFGAVGDNSTDNSTALQDAFDSGYPLEIDDGVYRFSTALTFGTGLKIFGVSPQVSRLTYTGSGYALANATPATRIHDIVLSNLYITHTGTATALLHLNDVSHGLFTGVQFQGTGIGVSTGVLIDGAVGGNSVYNCFVNCRALSFEHGWDINAIGSNETMIFGGRATACTRGVNIDRSNHTKIRGVSIESCATGVYIDATVANTSDATAIDGCRFENNTALNIHVVSANVRNTIIANNDFVTAPADSTDAGTRTQILGNVGADIPMLGHKSRVATVDNPHQFIRSGNATGTANVLVRDSSTSAGTPNTLTVSCGRPLSHALSVNSWNGTVDTEVAYITAQGDISCADIACVDLNPTGTLTVALGQFLQFGDGVTSGNAGPVWAKADANNMTCMTFRNAGNTSAHNRAFLQFNTAEALSMRACDASGNTLTAPAFRVSLNPVEGRTTFDTGRLRTNCGTAHTGAEWTASAGFGTGRAVAVATGCNDTGGRVTITCGTASFSADPTLTLAPLDGTWTTAPARSLVVRNGGTGTELTVTSWSWVSANSFVIQFTGTQTVASATYILEILFVG